ncbi:hypothetical protein KP509_04G029500 [Ceratopteris richardii]|uniref:Protein kinase domain-containing protein n=1 Tax=Ceratopteris richardii TaxID=49495 RepID=A0A8T2UZ17_CERRI|nr:hypothetical protein KP509_04G029500 [Ceratopteris richardii]
MALVSLRAAWQDPLDRLADWDATNTSYPCLWTAVTCDASSSITSLNLSGFSISGTLPAAIANLSSITELDFSYTALSGSIPNEIGSLSFLTYLSLSHNRFNSTIPDGLFRSTSLKSLLLDNNHISGALPLAIGSLKTLRHFSVAYNDLAGSMPISIATLPQLSILLARSNRFTGNIPSYLGNLSSLIKLDLGENLLVGDIPRSIGSLQTLQELNLSGNLLAGPLPAELGNLQVLISLDLSHNFLNGTIPLDFGKLTSLELIDLCYNKLGGTIPSELGDLHMLRSVNLSFNDFTGVVPTALGLRFDPESFAGNPHLCTRRPCGRDSHFRHQPQITGAVLGGTFALVVFFAMFMFCVCNRTTVTRSRRGRVNTVDSGSSRVEIANTHRNAIFKAYDEDLAENYEVIVSCAGYFDTAHVIGKGRFSTVYECNLSQGERIAVKVFNNPIYQPAFEEAMARLHELLQPGGTLLQIKGYYSSSLETAIFYDFMCKGSLRDLLHTSPALLDWNKRINIAKDISQALHCLHTASPSMLHEDLKSSNVLLDDDLKPYVADYCLNALTHRSVVQTPGYTPPEFTCPSFFRRQYTEKTDVYSFGIVLLELLTGKSPIGSDECASNSVHKDRVRQENSPSLRVHDEEDGENSQTSKLQREFGEDLHLVTLVLGFQKGGNVLELSSPIVSETCPSLDHQVRAFKLALRCIDQEPTSRPSMEEILRILGTLTTNSLVAQEMP